MDRSDPEAWEQLDSPTRRVLAGFNRRYHHFARFTIWALVGLAVLQVGNWALNAYLLDQNSTRASEAKAQGYDAALAGCLSGSDFRILVANGFDELRRGAVPGDAGPRHLLVAFYLRTQPPIDGLLTQAAYEDDSGRTYRTRTPLGEVTDAVEQEVRELARRRCEARTREQFPGVMPARR